MYWQEVVTSYLYLSINSRDDIPKYAKMSLRALFAIAPCCSQEVNIRAPVTALTDIKLGSLK